LNIIAFKNFDSFFKISSDDFILISRGLVKDFQKRWVEFDDKTLKKIAAFGGEKLVTYISFEIFPLITFKDEANFFSEYRLLDFYVGLCSIVNPNDIEGIANKTLYGYYKNALSYQNFYEEAGILSRRFLTIEKESVAALFPVLLEIIRKYPEIKINKESAKKNLEDLIEKSYLRLSSEKDIDFSAEFTPIIISLTEEASSIGIPSEKFILLTELRMEKTKNSEIIPLFNINTKFIFLLISISPLFFLLLLFNKSIRVKTLSFFGLRKKALDLYRRISVEKPGNPDTHVKIAQLLSEMNRGEEALKEFRIASRLVQMRDIK